MIQKKEMIKETIKGTDRQTDRRLCGVLHLQ